MLKSTFPLKYPILDEYIKNESIRNNMMINGDMFLRYISNKELLKSFIFEAKKYFDVDTISKILIDILYKFDDNTFRSFLVAYLNSEETAKSSEEVLNYYKKTLSMGIEAVLYIEENGIIVNKNYKEIFKIINDDDYNERIKNLEVEYQNIATGKERYRDEFLKDVYYNLNEEEKLYVNQILKNNSFDLLEDLFKEFNYHLSTLITILSLEMIDASVINHENINKLGKNVMMMLVYCLVEKDSKQLTDNIKYLISIERFDLIKDIALNNLISEVGGLSKSELDINDNEVIISLLVKRKVKTKNNDDF